MKILSVVNKSFVGADFFRPNFPKKNLAWIFSVWGLANGKARRCESKGGSHTLIKNPFASNAIIEQKGGEAENRVDAIPF